MLRPLTSALILLVSACGGGGDDGGPGGEGDACTSTRDCRSGLSCRDSTCQRDDDAGPRPDGGRLDAGQDAGPGCPAARACGDGCCEPGQVCGGGACCPVADLCGGVCCGGDQSCVAETCVLACADDQTPCGSGADGVCCAGEDVCYLGACTTPGDPCASTRDCPEGAYCEGAVGRCLPRAEGGAECEYMPPVGEFTLEREWSWTGDAEVLPDHTQVMMAPVVANLTDDDGDGRIDQNDVPDVVFHTFRRRGTWISGQTAYWHDGVVRAISGADGSRVWPTADPGYRSCPGGEIAIADVDPASPGPEVLACSQCDTPSRAPGHLMILAADGALLRRFDTAPNDVPCGFDAPAVGDMDGDGVPEILVRYVIAHGDGLVVSRIRDDRGTGGAYNSLADVDGDGELEVVGGDGVYDLDGTPVWERRAGDADRPAVPSGHTAIADLDLDGDAEIVVINAGNHDIRALDAATGDDHWLPVDINPPELADQVAADPSRGSGGGPPTIANFDDDPFPEIAFAGGFAYVVFEHDGTRKWWYETVDRSSRGTGSSIFDFEGDGVAEVLYNDERTFRVFRGPDGSIFHDECNTSGTLREYPIVVDVDNDDHAEIILMENDYAFACLDGTASSTGIHAFGHPTNQWVRTRRIWNQHTYHVTNIEEDGTVPRAEVANWSDDRLNNFRQNVQPDGLFDAPDLVLIDLTATTRGCPTTIGLAVRVVNEGRASAPAGVPVSFWETSRGGRMLVGRAPTTRPLLPGESELVVLAPPFAIPPESIAATFVFEATLNDPADMPIDGFHECRVDNNAAGPAEAACPLVE